MDKINFKNELSFHTLHKIIIEWLEKGFITYLEYKRLQEILIEKYTPLFAIMWAEKP